MSLLNRLLIVQILSNLNGCWQTMYLNKHMHTYPRRAVAEGSVEAHLAGNLDQQGDLEDHADAPTACQRTQKTG